MDEIGRSIKRAIQLINRARERDDLVSESRGVSALRDFQNIRARYKHESLTEGTVDDRLCALLKDDELLRAYLDWVVLGNETPVEAIGRLSRKGQN